jgi:RNA polymerase sigma factor (sigma-70 family)
MAENMDHQVDSTIFLEFKQRYQQSDSTSIEAEEAFITRMAPAISRVASSKLTNDVRRLFDTNDITNTVMRRVVSHLRSGQITLDSESQFHALLGTITKCAIIDKHDYLHRLLGAYSRQACQEFMPGDTSTKSTSWDLIAKDEGSFEKAGITTVAPIDDFILAKKIKSLNELCGLVRKHLGSPDDWELFRLRFFEELPWQQIAEHLGTTPDAAWERMIRNIEQLRPKIQHYNRWLDEQS